MAGLRPEVSLPTALATGAIVWAIYDSALPPVADVRSAPAHDDTIHGTERMAAWTAAGVVGGISLISKDPNVFIVGSAMIVALSWWHRHANAVNPDTGRAATVTAVRTPQLYDAGAAA